MMKNQPIVRLNFTCDRNWDDMQPVESGRFCNDCQKKVVDFTDKTNYEIAAYLMSSTTKVCGKFENAQLVLPLPNLIWKHWLSAAAMFVAVFTGIKEASAQQQPISVKLVDSVVSFKPGMIGEVVIFSNEGQFSGGKDALQNYLNTNFRLIKGVHGIIKTTFLIEKDGSLSNIEIIESLTHNADEEVIRVLKDSPKWLPRTLYGGKTIACRYNLLIDF